MPILLLVVVTDTLYCPLENNLCEGQIFYFLSFSFIFFFFLSYYFYWTTLVGGKNLVSKRWYFLTGGQVTSRDENWGVELRRVQLTQCAPHPAQR